MSQEIKPLLNIINERDYQCEIGILRSSSSGRSSEVKSNNTNNDSGNWNSLIDYVYGIFSSPTNYDEYINHITEFADGRLDIDLKYYDFIFDKTEYFNIVNEFINNIVNNNQQNNILIKICPNEDNKFNYFIHNNKLILYILSKNEKDADSSIESRNIVYTDIRIKKVITNVYEIERHIVSCDMNYYKQHKKTTNLSVFEYLNNECAKDIMKK